MKIPRSFPGFVPLSFLAALVLFAGFFPAASGGEIGAEEPRKRYIISMKDHASPERFLQARGMKGRRDTAAVDNVRHQSLETDEALVLEEIGIFIHELTEAEARALQADPNVHAVEEDGPVFILDELDLILDGRPPPFPLDEQVIGDGIRRMGFDKFPFAGIDWSQMLEGVEVAVLDSGIDDHHDLHVIRHLSTVGKPGIDEDGHGTAVAGALGARDNGIGVVGVAPGVAIWDIKVGSPTNNSWSAVTQGLNRVLQNADRISVVNLSLGNAFGQAPSALRDRCLFLVRAGVVVVAGAGNNHMDLAGPDGVFSSTGWAVTDDYLPAAAPEVMAVSAMNPNTDQIWVEIPGVRGSNFSAVPAPRYHNAPPTLVYPVSKGLEIDVAAPGVDIITTAAGVDADGVARNYMITKGTSFATPHVTGLVALYIAANGRAYDEQGVYKIRQAIIDTAEALAPQSTWDTDDTLDTDGFPEALAVPSLDWLPMPELTLSIDPEGAVVLTAANRQKPWLVGGPKSLPGFHYRFQRSADLLEWTTLATLPGDGLALEVTDPATPGDRAFYRIERIPAPSPSPDDPENFTEPVIVEQLKPITTTYEGGSVELRAAATGNPAPNLQWQRSTDGGASWVDLIEDEAFSGVASRVLTLLDPTAEMDGDRFRLWSENVAGSVVSLASELTVLTGDSFRIPNTVAAATSELSTYSRVAVNLVDGHFAENGDLLGYGEIWESVGITGTPNMNDYAPKVQLDLGRSFGLQTIRVWNFPEVDPAVKRMTIAVSDDKVNFTDVLTVDGLAHFNWNVNDFTEIDLSGVNARYIRFEIHENWGGSLYPIEPGTDPGGLNGYAGLTEISIIGGPLHAPEPESGIAKLPATPVYR